MTSVINFINTGTGANAGNGDSLRTAFNKINRNFVDLENSYVQSGVASFNGTGGVITFTATDITNLLGFIPYNSGNPSQYVTQSSVDGLASLLYLNSNFVTTATILNYTTKNYVDTNLAQYATLDFLSAQNYISNVTLPSFLTLYATQAYVGTNFISTASIGQYLNQGKTDLLPAITNTYNIGNELVSWRTLYLSDSIYIGNTVITVNSVTNKLMVDNQGLTGGYSFDPQNIYNNNVSFDISASYNPLISPAAAAGIHFPNNTQASVSSIRVYNTATGGIVLDGKTTQVLVDEGNIAGVEIRGNVKLPVTFSDGQKSNGHRLVINPNVVGLTTSGFRVEFYDQPLAISAINSGTSTTPVRMSIIGNEVAIFSRWEGLTNQAQVLTVTTSGVFVGTTNTGYVLPSAIGATGTTLISDGQGLVSWSTQTFGSTSINSQNAVFTTATITKRFRLGTEGLTFFDGSNMITAYGNQQVSDFLPQYTGALSVGYIAGLGTSVSLISNGLTWAFSATGVLSLPSGCQIGELYGNGVDIRSNPSGYVKLVSNSGNNYLKIDNLGAYVFATNNQWTFGTDGNLTLPAGGDIVDSSGASVLGGTGTALGDRLTTSSYSVVLGSTGTLTVPGSIVPDADIAYDLGTPSNRFRDLYLSTSTIYLGAATISANGSALELPVGTTTGGVSIGTIIILGSVANSTALTAISTATLRVGDSYVVASPAPAHLWTWNRTAFIDLGVFQGPQGDLGYTGSQGVGFTGSRGDTGYVGSRGSAGTQGVIGFTGSNGYVGSRGYTGSSGSAGTQGVIGFTGSSGAGTTLTITSGTGIIVTTSGTIVTISATTSGSGFIGSSGIGFVGSQGAAGASGISFSISASGSSDYIFSGPGIEAGNTNDPVLYLYRGFTYSFVNTTGGSHPFAIRVSSGGADYTTGVSGSQSGTQTFTVPMNAPSTLYYQCTFHGGMGNVINIV